MRGQKQLLSSAKNKKDKASGSSDNWGTPQELYDILNSLFHFTVDLAADKKSALHENYCTDAFTYRFDCDRFYLNPPYSVASKFVDLVLNEGNLTRYDSGVILLACRPDTKAFQKLATHSMVKALFLVSGRLRFRDPMNQYEQQKNPATFPSLLVFLGKEMQPWASLIKTDLGIKGLWIRPSSIVQHKTNVLGITMSSTLKEGLRKRNRIEKK